MATNKVWITRGIFSIGNNLAVVLLRFISFYFIVRSLSKVDFGVWVLFLLVVSILEVVRNGLIRNALIRFLAISDEQESRNIQSASIVLNFTITLIGLAIVLLLSTTLGKIWDAPALKTMFWIYSISAIFLVLLSHIEFVATAHSKFDKILIFNFVRHAGFLVIVLYLLYGGVGVNLNNLVAGQAISVAVSLLIGVLILIKHIKFSKHITKKWLKELFEFGRYVVGTNLGTIIFKSTDQMMLGAILGTQPVAVYNTALRINNLIDTPIMGVSNIFYPHSSRKGHEGFNEVYVKSVSIILSILMPALIGIFFFSDFIIYIIAGKEYAESAGILKVTMLYSVFIPFARQFGTLLDSIGKPQINLRLTAFSSIINILFSYLGIVLFGTIGAAYGTLVTYVTSFIIIQIYLNRTYQVSLPKIFIESFRNYGKIMRFGKNWLSSRTSG